MTEEEAKKLYEQYQEHRITTGGSALAYITLGGMSYYDTAVNFAMKMTESEAKTLMIATRAYKVYLEKQKKYEESSSDESSASASASSSDESSASASASSAARSSSDSSSSSPPSWTVIEKDCTKIYNDHMSSMNDGIDERKKGLIEKRTKAKSADKKDEVEKYDKLIKLWQIFSSSYIHRFTLRWLLTENKNAQLGATVGKSFLKAMAAVGVLAAWHKVAQDIQKPVKKEAEAKPDK